MYLAAAFFFEIVEENVLGAADITVHPERFCNSLKTSKKNTDQNFWITQIHLPLPSSKNGRVRKRDAESSLQD